MDNEKLSKKLEAFFDGERASVTQLAIERAPTSLDQIRDAMLDIGVILEEDLEQGIYVCRVTGGRRKNYGPIIAATPSENGVDVAGVIVRGRIRPVNEAVEVFKDSLEGNPPRLKQRHPRLKFFIPLILLLTAVVEFALVIPTRTATIKYNEAVAEYNTVVPGYNDAVFGLSVENLRGFIQEATELDTQDTGFLSICRELIRGNRAEKIEKDTTAVSNMAKELSAEIPVLNAIRNPSEDWVVMKLKNVDEIDGIGAVTSSNDPNGMLNKDGGYSSCVYFTTELFDKDVVKGDTPVQKGVDGGGAIEVYPTLEDAKARCEYLSEFDNTILYSGSYALVGTMVIRTSCLLDDNAQYTLTNNIVTSMIEM